MLTKIFKNKIIENFEKYSDDLEVEVRFGFFSNGSYTNRVNNKTFIKIKNYLDKNYNSIEINTIDFMHNKIRKTVCNNESHWIIKEEIFNEVNIRNGLNYSISREKIIQPVENFKPDVIRKKKRFSYIIYDVSISIDITEIVMDKETFYEIEAELLNYEKIKLFENIIFNIFKIVLNSKQY